MGITQSFRKGAEQYAGCLDIDTGKIMTEKGYRLLEFRGENYEIPDPSWHSLMEDLGGEAAIDADYNEKDEEGVFTVTHKESGITVKSNGAVHAFADLWLQLHP